ncbi:MAG: hypothetical protein ACPL1K_06005 [Candidatus Kryptoniota bacterium]
MKKLSLFTIVAVLFLALAFAPGNAYATKWYVNVLTGLDSYDGSSPIPNGPGVGPKQTINNAIAAASPGDTIYVAWANGNLYNENVVVPRQEFDVYLDRWNPGGFELGGQ